jgi:hypothetical protein
MKPFELVYLKSRDEFIFILFAHLEFNFSHSNER